MNTELSYLYRDASNYKFMASVIFSGRTDQSAVSSALSGLDHIETGRYWIDTGRVKIPHPLSLTNYEWNEEVDHPAVEVEAADFTTTNAEPTDRRTIDEFLQILS